MTQLYMLDTNTVSYILKGLSPKARIRLSKLLPGEVVCISSITEGELWFGLDRIGGGAARRNALRDFLAPLQVLPWGREEAAAYGVLRSKQEAMGRPLGPLDTLIAAHAIAVGAVLVSNDAAFRQVVDLPGLDTWASDLPSRA